MTDEIELGPLLYAFLKGVRAYNEASVVSENVKVESPDDNILLKILSPLLGGIEKYSDAAAPDFLKKYKTYEFILSRALKLLG